jgi:hypothetical protein
MEKEYSTMDRRQTSAGKFLQRIKDCEKRGLDFKQGIQITPDMLDEFENTGRVISTTTEDRKKLLTWTPADAERSYQRNMKKIADQKKLNEILKEIDDTEKLKSTGLCFIERGDSQKTTLFI